MIEQIFLTAVFAVFNSFLTHFLVFCLGDPHKSTVTQNRIFSKIGNWLVTKYEIFEAEEKNRIDMRLMEDSNMSYTQAEGRRRINPWKAIVCPICFNVWTGIASCLVLVISGALGPWAVLPMLVTSSYIFRQIFKQS